MYTWQDKLIDLTNEHDHEIQHALPKQLDSITINSPGRYHILLSRIPGNHSQPEIDALVMEEYGLEQLQPEQPQQCHLPAQALPGDDLKFVFGLSSVGLGGEIGAFKAEKGIGDILGCRSVINDGNTIVHHFWDGNFQYVLLHEIKY